MKYEVYKTEASEDFLEFRFISEGPKGFILKTVKYQDIFEDFYNLGFGDTENEQTDDSKVTHNRDTKKVLATVCSTMVEFFRYHPAARVVISPKTESRVRFFRMMISNNLEDLRKHLNVYGIINGRAVPFKKGLTYDAYMFRNRNILIL